MLITQSVACTLLRSHLFQKQSSRSQPSLFQALSESHEYCSSSPWVSSQNEKYVHGHCAGGPGCYQVHLLLYSRQHYCVISIPVHLSFLRQFARVCLLGFY